MRIAMILGVHEAAALQRIAAREDRPVRDQALRMLIGALIRSGDLAPEALSYPLTASEGGEPTSA